eukprot:324934-Rhodomonas_salina.1
MEIRLDLEIHTGPPACLRLSPFGEVNWHFLWTLTVCLPVQIRNLEPGSPRLAGELCGHHCVVQGARCKPVVVGLQHLSQLRREPRVVQRSAPFPACVMPRVCLRQYCFEKTKTRAELLKLLICLGQDCPNPTLLSA